MKQQCEFSGKTVELAVKEAAEKLGISEDKLKYEVIEQEKAGFLGIGSIPARIMVEQTVNGETAARNFIETLLSNMEVEADVRIDAPKKSDRIINITGEDAGVLIGHHGDTLDALQYLTNLAANKREEDESHDYVHISVDVENYRAKREQTLRALARRMASKVLKTGKNTMLEPMTPYERRIIHSEVQGIEGVSTNSVGTENNRRVVIFLESAGFSIPKSEQHRIEKAEKPRRERSNRPQQKRSKPEKPAAPLYSDGDEMSAEELSELISTYGSREHSHNSEQPKKFKDFDEYINSLTGGSDGEDNKSE